MFLRSEGFVSMTVSLFDLGRKEQKSKRRKERPWEKNKGGGWASKDL